MGCISETFTISCCTNMRCNACPKLKILHNMKSSGTNRTYQMINHTDEHLNYHANNLVFLLTYNFCLTQYVGETASNLNMRMNCHCTAKSGFEHIIYHSKNSCGSHHFSYQTLEKLP